MIYNVINVIFFIIVSFLIVVGFFYNSSNNKLNKVFEKVNIIINKHYKFFVITLFLLSIFLSIYMLGSVPYGLHVDEAGMAYDARLLAEYGVDRYLNDYPVYLINYGGGQSAMYAYLTAILIKMFGYSTLMIKLPAIIINFLLMLSAYWIIKEKSNKITSLLFLLLLTIVPYFIMQSRWGLDCNLMVGLLTISIAFLIKSITKNKLWLLFISGVLFGFTLYTYALSYIVVPILLIFISVYLLYLKHFNIKRLIVFGLPIFLLALPLILMVLINNGIIPEIKSFITIPLLHEYRATEISLTNIFNNFYILLSILTIDNSEVFGNILIYNSLSYFGTLYYIAIPFVIIGLIVCFKESYLSVKEKKFNLSVIICLWFLSVIICQLLIVEPNINKANAVFVPLVYFLVIGILRVTTKFNGILIPIIILFIINFLIFFNYYFFHYNDYHIEHQPFYATKYLDALDYSKSLNKTKFYIEENITAQSHIYVALDNFVSPHNYNSKEIITMIENQTVTYQFSIPSKIDEEAVYIIHNNSELFKELKDRGFTEKSYGGFSVLNYE